MNKELLGKRIKSCQLRDYAKFQRLGFINKDIKPFDQLVNGKIQSATSRGSVILVEFDNGMNLILAPEYAA
jgi:hypothetical protein